MEDYLEAVKFWNIAVKTDSGFKCKLCSKEYGVLDDATVKSHRRHIGVAECRGSYYPDILLTILRKQYDGIPLDETDNQRVCDAFGGGRNNNTRYPLRSRIKNTSGDSVPTATTTTPPTQCPSSSSSNYAVRSRIIEKKKKKKAAAVLSQFSGHASYEDRGGAASVLREVAPIINGVFSEMEKMVALFKSKLDTQEEQSLVGMQKKLQLFKHVVKSKLNTAILPPIA